jgi:hypothetical protein
MAGSITWKRYTDDAGNNWSYQCNKHLAGAVVVVGGAGRDALSLSRGQDYPELPCTIEKRYVLLSLIYINEGAAGIVSRRVRNAKRIKVTIGNPLALESLLSPDLQYVFFTADGESINSAWSPTFISGERRSLKTLIYGQAQ